MSNINTNNELHTNLKWSTLEQRANDLVGFTKYHIDTAYNSIYEFCSDQNAFVHLMNANNKQDFIDHILGFEEQNDFCEECEDIDCYYCSDND